MLMHVQLIDLALCGTKVRGHAEGMDCMTLPMSWDEWAQHDGTALAERVKNGELTAAELAAQAAAGVAKVNPALSGVVELFEDAIVDPAEDGTNLDGPFAGLPFLMKDLGPTAANGTPGGSPMCT